MQCVCGVVLTQCTDQCAPSSNYKDYASYLNVNGSICLSFTCYWANVTAGQPCIVDNTYYEGTSDSNVTFAYMVSRDKCVSTPPPPLTAETVC